MNEEKRDQMIREAFDECREKVNSLPSRQEEIIREIEKPSAAYTRVSSRALAIPAALVLLVCIGLGIAAGRQGRSYPDTIRNTEAVAAAQPEPTDFVPLAAPAGDGQETENQAVPEAFYEKMSEYLKRNHSKLDLSDLVPLNLSCEDQGIRMEIISAAAKEKEALIVYSLQDLTGGRINQDTLHDSPLFLEQDIGSNFNGDLPAAAYDESQNRIFIAERHLYEAPYRAGKRQVTLHLENLAVIRKTEIDLLPILEKYGSQAQELIDPPADLYSRTYYGKDEISAADTFRRLELKVLDYHHPMDIILTENLQISGIGIREDGLMHVQFHYLDNIREEGDRIFPKAWIRVNTYYWRFEDPEMEDYFEANPVQWENDGSGYSEWEEYVFPWNPEEEQKKLTAELVEIPDVVTGDWTVQVPFLQIWKGAEDYAGMYTDAFFAKNIRYEVLEDGNARIVESVKYKTWEELMIPAELDGHPVTEIGDYAFADCEYLETVVIPEGVKAIGHAAFANCGTVRELRLPESLESIEDLSVFRSFGTSEGTPVYIVTEGSYAEQFCRDHELPYRLADE